MPGLNITFTDEELARLRKRAKNEGVSMRTMAHDTIVSSDKQAEEDDRVMAAVARVMSLSADLLARLADK
jgi:hypothetical protein